MIWHLSCNSDPVLQSAPLPESGQTRELIAMQTTRPPRSVPWPGLTCDWDWQRNFVLIKEVTTNQPLPIGPAGAMKDIIVSQSWVNNETSWLSFLCFYQHWTGDGWLVVSGGNFCWHFVAFLFVYFVYLRRHTLNGQPALPMSAVAAKSVLITDLRPGYKCLSAWGWILWPF